MSRYWSIACLLSAAFLCGFTTYANLPDAELVTQIREKLVQDSTLSELGKRVSIEISGGNVVLKGPVQSEFEETRILETAKDIAGTRGVTDNMTMLAE